MEEIARGAWVLLLLAAGFLIQRWLDRIYKYCSPEKKLEQERDKRDHLETWLSFNYPDAWDEWQLHTGEKSKQ